MQSKAESIAVKIFVSYAPKDEGYKQQLLKHLSPLVRQGSITSWDAQQIRAGSEQHEEALKHFYEADIILCLLSSDFIHSEYCTVEMDHAWKRRESEEIVVLPILLRAVELQGTAFSKLQIIPRNKKPIIGRSNRDKLLSDVAREIAMVADSVRTKMFE